MESTNLEKVDFWGNQLTRLFTGYDKPKELDTKLIMDVGQMCISGLFQEGIQEHKLEMLLTKRYDLHLNEGQKLLLQNMLYRAKKNC